MMAIDKSFRKTFELEYCDIPVYSNRSPLAWEDLNGILSSLGNPADIHPHYIEIHLGLSCPLSCIFCYSKGSHSQQCSYTKTSDNTVVTREEWTYNLLKLNENGAKNLIISGGYEPLSSKLVFDLLDDIGDKFHITLYTNGLLFTTKRLEKYLSKIDVLQFSIHAQSVQNFRAVQAPGSCPEQADYWFNKIKKIIRHSIYLKTKGACKTKIVIGTMLLSENRENRDSFVREWLDAGVDTIYLNQSNTYKTSKDAISDSSRLTLPEDSPLRNEKVILKREFRSTIHNPEHCFSFLAKVSIDPFGDVYTCCLKCQPRQQDNDNNKFLIGNMKQSDIIDLIALWNNQRKVDRLSQCRNCPDWEFLFNSIISNYLKTKV